eukprot:c15821_g1_i2 orf=654-962(-)
MEMDTAVDNMSNGRSVIGLAYPITLHGLLGIPMDDLQYDKENIDSMAMTARPASRSPLPSWYPRLPLQDITAVLRSMQVPAFIGRLEGILLFISAIALYRNS